MTSKIIVLFLVYFLSDFSHGQRNDKFFRKDYTYIEEAESFYKIHTERERFSEAKQVCAQESASLFYPENDNEAHTVISFWNRSQPDIKQIFVGMVNLSDKLIFETIDGKLVSDVYNKWRPNEPNNDENDEKCVTMDRDGLMNDIACHKTFAFVCKKSLQSVEWNFNCSMSNLGGQRNDQFFRKDYIYIEEVESFYKIHTKPQTWSDAKRLCALEGASLYYPKNGNEAYAVTSFWNTTRPTIEVILVGMSDIMGQLETIDGKAISDVYNNWKPGYPNNDYNENCVYLHNDGYITNGPCDNKEKFICKKSLHPLGWNYDCSMSNTDYIFANEKIGKCYKVHTTPLTWTEAYNVCQTEESYLAVINNHREAEHLEKLAESVPTPCVRGNYLRGSYHLGFHNRFSEGWWTVKGTPLKVNANAWWGNYQPIGNEQCGSMFFNGRLNNIDCDTRSFFICEHEADPCREGLELKI